MLPLAYPDHVNRAADYACVVFIFVYALGYSMGFGPAAWVYGSEVRNLFAAMIPQTSSQSPRLTRLSFQIFPTAVRARGLSFAASGGAVGSIIVAQVWPVGIANLGSKIYFFFMAINLACVPIVYLLYPETKGRPLESMDALFGGGSPGSSTENLLAERRDID